MKANIKKISLIVIDCLLAVYLIVAITAFNKPYDKGQLCESVVINIADENTNGFLSPEEIRQMLIASKIYPKNVPLSRINIRDIEELLMKAPFVKTAQCYTTTGDAVHIDLTQRTPLIRIKSQTGDDYYIDDQGGIMPNSKYTSDLIIATGNIKRKYAQLYITPMSQFIMNNNFWRNQVEQINITPDRSVEIVPRVGDHIINLGRLPENNDLKRRQREIEQMLDRKFTRLEKFYKYGLKQVGWNLYDYIDIEFDNQIICRRHGQFTDGEHQPKSETIEESVVPTPVDTTAQPPASTNPSENVNNRQTTI